MYVLTAMFDGNWGGGPHLERHGGDVRQEDSVEGLCYGNVVSSSQDLIAQLAERESGGATHALLHLSRMHHLFIQNTKQQKNAQSVIDCTHRQPTCSTCN